VVTWDRRERNTVPPTGVCTEACNGFEDDGGGLDAVWPGCTVTNVWSVGTLVGGGGRSDGRPEVVGAGLTRMGSDWTLRTSGEVAVRTVVPVLEKVTFVKVATPLTACAMPPESPLACRVTTAELPVAMLPPMSNNVTTGWMDKRRSASPLLGWVVNAMLVGGPAMTSNGEDTAAVRPGLVNLRV
jgi:hypothetical protein